MQLAACFRMLQSVPSPAEYVLHANVAPTAAADDRVRVSEAVVAEIEAEYEVFRNT